MACVRAVIKARVRKYGPCTYARVHGPYIRPVYVNTARVQRHGPCSLAEHTDVTWKLRLNRPCAAAMRLYVKLVLWLLVMAALRSRCGH